MFFPSRREFLGSSLLGLAASPSLFADSFDDLVKKAAGEYAFQPSTLFLTWQRDPTTTMTVQWIGVVGETTDTKIYYSNSFLSSWGCEETKVRPYPMSDFKVYRAELTGLRPGTDYWFRIGKQSPVYRFKTMPARATETIHFISGGDCGVNGHTIANNLQAARQNPMFAVVGGDLGYDNGKSVGTSLGFIRNYSQQMVTREGRMIPLIAGIGNHEVDGGYNKPRAKAPFFYALFDGLFSETGYAALDFGDYLSLILLDTGHTSSIDGAQSEWLDQTLRARAEHPNVFVVNHVPAYPSYRTFTPEKEDTREPAPELKEGAVEGKTKVKASTGAGNRKHWVPLFQKHRVPVVLEHHDHTFKRTKPLIDGLVNANGVLYLGDGSWGRLRTPKKPEKLPYLAASNGSYHLSLHRIQGEERFHLALDEFGRVMDVCHSGQRKAGIFRAEPPRERIPAPREK